MANTILIQQVEMSEGSDVDPLSEFCAFVSKSFFEPDIQAVRIILGAAFAHYIKDLPPIWLFVVGPPSSGKTSITVEALSGLQGMFGTNQPWGEQIEESMGEAKNTNRSYKPNEAVEILSTINPNTFLSHQQGVHAPGLLEQLNKKGPMKEKDGNREISWGNALMLVPDFTVMSSMQKEKRGEVMGQLRRIYDRAFEKKVGTKVTKIWQGKVSMLAATTPVIDKYTTIESALGERFIQIKWRASDDPGRAVFALKQLAAGEKIKAPMKQLVRDLFANARPEKLQLDDATYDRLAALSELIAIGRTSVYGSFQNQQHFQDQQYVVKEVACSEDVYRMALQYYGTLSGICRLSGRDVPTEQDIQDVLRVGIDSLSTYRSIVMQAAIEGLPLKAFAARRRDLHKEALCLYELGVIEKAHIGEGPVKLKPKFQSVIDRCGFAPGVFEPDGAEAGGKRTKRAHEVEKDAGLHDEVL